jgi:subtilase family serine protease
MTGLTIALLAASLSPVATRAATPDTTPIEYHADPPRKLAFAATAVAPTALPTPSQCEALFGVACYTPQLVRTAYNVPSTLTGAGQTIVIVDAYGSPTIQSDLHIFDQLFGLPDPQLNIIYPGGRPPFNANNSTEVGWAGETTLDVEWSHAIAPDATIDLVIAASRGGNDLNIAQRYAVDNHLGNVMSLSFGAPEAAISGHGNNFQLRQAEQIYQAAKAAGITVVAAAGDWGDANVGIFNPSGPRTAGPNALYPASSPSVLAVGGTYLFAADNGAYTSETAWNDFDPNTCPFGCRYFGQFPFTLATGGAPSLIFPAPAYQQGSTGYTMRTTADVAYNAALYTAVLTYVGYNPDPSLNGIYFSAGTSEGAPQWAGVIALADQAAGRALGFVNPTLYGILANPATYAADFHDVTTGNNEDPYPGCCYSAATGYDLPTGLGTPNVANLIHTLAGN